MTRIRLFLLVLISVTSSMGCNRKSTEAQIAVNPYQAAKIYTETELNTLITPGMSMAEVTNKFGLPGSAVKVTENLIYLTYMFPFDVGRTQGTYMTGFGIDVKDGRVIRWSPVTGMIGKTIEGGGSQDSFGEQSFQIILATDSLSNVVNTVNSQGSADASALNVSPDMVFKAKVFAGNSDSEHPGEQTVILVVSDQDASKLKDLTQNNFGKRMLIICQNTVIAAPTIAVPIASKQFMFTVKDSRVLGSLRKN